MSLRPRPFKVLKLRPESQGPRSQASTSKGSKLRVHCSRASALRAKSLPARFDSWSLRGLAEDRGGIVRQPRDKLVARTQAKAHFATTIYKKKIWRAWGFSGKVAKIMDSLVNREKDIKKQQLKNLIFGATSKSSHRHFQRQLKNQYLEGVGIFRQSGKDDGYFGQ